MSERPLFAHATPDDEIKAALRAEGFSEEAIDKIPPDSLANVIHKVRNHKNVQESVRAGLVELIEQGRLTKAAADAMTWEEQQAYTEKTSALKYYRREWSSSRVREKAAPLPDDALSRGDVATVMSRMLAIVAAQQAQIDELTNQVATLHNANLAIYGQQKVIDQLTAAERDFEGFEVTMELEEAASLRSEQSDEMSSDHRSASTDAANTGAAIKGLASHIAGIDVARKVNMSEMDRHVEKMRETAKRSATTRSKGRVHIKIGKVTGGRRKP